MESGILIFVIGAVITSWVRGVVVLEGKVEALKELWMCSCGYRKEVRVSDRGISVHQSCPECGKILRKVVVLR